MREMNKTQGNRLQKITEAGTQRVTRLNAADHSLRKAGLITIESEPTGRGSFTYILRPTEALTDESTGATRAYNPSV